MCMCVCVCVCVCVCARMHNDNPILSKMLSKACLCLADPKIHRIASGIKILKNTRFWEHSWFRKLRVKVV